jgi:putative transposase
MVSISRKGAQWFISFSYEHQSTEVLRDAAELAYEADLLDDEALSAATVAYDRNVKDNAFYGSKGDVYMLKEKELERIEKTRVRTKRYQRTFSRCTKGSKNQTKARHKVAKSRQYEVDVLDNFAHQTSHAIVSDKETKVIGFELLQLMNLVRRPKAKKDPKTGKWLKNGARAKAGLNKALLSRALGATVSYTHYKAYRFNKLVVSVAPHFSSQECSRCGHTHPDNRNGQRFVCQKCHFTAHADDNASQVLKKRTMAKVRSKELQVPKKAPKRVSMRRKTPLQGAGSSG